jgi:sterol desaturase/sphingolipid hydroxylase (fatty acid hydroxylase superfamily)
MSSTLFAAPRGGPALVDPRGPRFGAAVTTVVLAAALLTGSVWLLAVQAAVFALGAVGRSPYGVVYARLVRPRLRPPAELEDTRPLRFAQLVGLGFTAVALAGLALPAVTVVATAFALAAAFLNAAFGICLGCEVYLLLRRATSSAPIARTVPTDRSAHRTEVSA